LVADFSAEGWSRLKQAVSTRHRITHPKTTADLHVSEDDLSACLSGFFWLLEVVTSAMGSANAQFAEHVQEMRRILDGLERGDPEIWKEYRSAKNALESWKLLQAKRGLVRFQNRLHFMPVIRIHLSEAHDLTHDLGVVADSFSLGIGVANIVGDALLFFLEAFNALDQQAQAVVGGFCHVNLFEAGGWWTNPEAAR
jgi:hypothetical protein